MYEKAVIKFGFCDICNIRGHSKCYQPSASADDIYMYHDLDFSGHHKNLIQ